VDFFIFSIDVGFTIALWVLASVRYLSRRIPDPSFIRSLSFRFWDYFEFLSVQKWLRNILHNVFIQIIAFAFDHVFGRKVEK
jgi:hypothetical protein